MQPILIVEDDQSFGYILSEYLDMHDMKSVWAKSAEEALEYLPQNEFCLALLDIMLPGMSGFDLAEKLSQAYPQIPFLFVSAKRLKVDQLKGYKLGAFDYITKPIDEELLVAKIKALLAISSLKKTKTIVDKYGIGKYTFLPNEQQLKMGTQIYSLTTRESELLLMMVEHKNQLLSRKIALQKIWGSTDEFSRKSMDVFISHLRKYLSLDEEVSIQNVHGKGFILKC